MIQSMTGFGKAVVELPHKKITVEIKSLIVNNSIYRPVFLSNTGKWRWKFDPK